VQGRNQGGKNFLGSESPRRAPKNANNVASTVFNTVHLLPEDLRFEHVAPNLILAPGAI